MTITYTNQGAATGTSGTSIQKTGLLFAAVNNLVLIGIVHSQAAASVADATSITATNLSGIVKLATVGNTTNAAPKTKVELWAALVANLTSVTATVNFAAATNGARAEFYEWGGVDHSVTSGGIDGVVQHAGAANDAASTTYSVPLSSPMRNNLSAGFLIAGGGQTTSLPKSGWTEGSDQQVVNVQEYTTMYRLATTDNAPGGSWTGNNVPWSGIAAEIGAGSGVALQAKAATATSAKQGVVLQYR
jgi:hypothetical protein